MLESWQNASVQLDLSVLNQGGEGCLASWGWGVLPELPLDGSTHRHALHRIWQRVSPFGLGDCLGAGVGEAAVVGCSSMGEVFCGGTSGGD